jgi:septal ring-binding cell division protein DamX
VRPGPAVQRLPDRPVEAQTAEERGKAVDPSLESKSRGRVDLAQERYAATQEWLKTAPGDYYAIQVLTVKDSELARLEGFLLKASKRVPREDFRVYRVKIDGVQCYRAAYGLYPNLEETLAAMRELPPLLAAQKPYYRSVERMRSQNRQ